MDNLIEEKCFDFSLKIISLSRNLNDEKKEYVIAKQLLRSGTSIGANVAEAQYAQSEADFISKNSIALKEAAETHYWLRLLESCDFMSESEVDELILKCAELKRILNAIVRSSKKKHRKVTNT